MAKLGLLFVENPSFLHIIAAMFAVWSDSLQTLIIPQRPLSHTSTLPSLLVCPSVNLSAPSWQSIDSNHIINYTADQIKINRILEKILRQFSPATFCDVSLGKPSHHS